MTEKKEEGKKDEMITLKDVAKKDWRIVHNQYDIKLKGGKPIGELPKKFLAALKTEKVI